MLPRERAAGTRKGACGVANAAARHGVRGGHDCGGGWGHPRQACRWRRCGSDAAVAVGQGASGDYGCVRGGASEAIGQLACSEPETRTASETTSVTMNELSDAEIREYVATGEPMDKAGAYAIQGMAVALDSANRRRLQQRGRTSDGVGVFDAARAGASLI